MFPVFIKKYRVSKVDGRWCAFQADAPFGYHRFFDNWLTAIEFAVFANRTTSGWSNGYD